MNGEESLMEKFRRGEMDAFQEPAAQQNMTQQYPPNNGFGNDSTQFINQQNPNMTYNNYQNGNPGFQNHNNFDQDSQYMPHDQKSAQNFNNTSSYSQNTTQNDLYAQKFGDQFTGQGAFPQDRKQTQNPQSSHQDPYFNNMFNKMETLDMKTGVACSFKDLMTLKKFDPPEIEVCDPQIKKRTTGTHHVYKIIGKDHHGMFEIFRRFREFHHLRRVLYSRFLGLYVPPMPEKKSLGNTDNFFVEERMYFLDRFLKEVCQLPYLYESTEFQVFLRPQGEVEKALDSLPPLTTDELLARFRNSLPINEMAGDFKLKQYNENINEFVKECRDFLEHLNKFKNQIKIIVPIKEQEVQYYKNFVDFLIKYEETNMRKVQHGDPIISLLVGENRIDLKDQLTKTTQSIKNPFKHVRNWIRGEIMELSALIEAISRKEGIEAAKSKAQTRVKDSKETVDKMNTGKFTVKGLFKSQAEKAAETQNILQTISQSEKDIQNYEIIKNYLIIYLAEIAIPAFKHQKLDNYLTAMSLFCNQEINNAKCHSECWSDFLETIKKVKK